MQVAKVRMQGAKVRASISASRYQMQQQHATTTITTTDQIGPAQLDVAILREGYIGLWRKWWALTQVAMITASCCGGPIQSVVVVVVVVSCCIRYRLALMLTFAPCVLTSAPCAYGVSIFELLQPFHLHRWWLSPVATCDGGDFLCSHWYLQSIASEVFTRGRLLKASFSKETIFTLPLGDYSSTGQQGG